MDTGALTELLGRFPPFDGLEAQRLADLAGRARTVRFRPANSCWTRSPGPCAASWSSWMGR
jgi:hypothetical protein